VRLTEERQYQIAQVASFESKRSDGRTPRRADCPQPIHPPPSDERAYGRGKRLVMDEKDRSASLTKDSDIRA
jgi:hypothetical protein